MEVLVGYLSGIESLTPLLGKKMTESDHLR